MDYEHLPKQKIGFGRRFRDIVRYIGVVLLVGMVVATAFTLWTPASVLPRNAARDIARAMATRVGRIRIRVPTFMNRRKGGRGLGGGTGLARDGTGRRPGAAPTLIRKFLRNGTLAAECMQIRLCGTN